MSDEWRAYSRLKKHKYKYKHLTVNHKRGYLNPMTGAGTNGIESCWRHVKASLPTYNRRERFFKGYLAKYMYCLKMKNTSNDGVKVFFGAAGQKFSVKVCNTHAGLALSELRTSTLNACCKTIWPECVKSKNYVSEISDEYRSIITLTHAVGGEGFDDLAFDDIDNLLVEKVLSEDEIIDIA